LLCAGRAKLEIMNIESGSKLFVVQFGKPDTGGWISMGSSNGLTDLFVIAKSYDEAAQKALEYAYEKTEKQSFVDYDGSLKVGDTEVKIKAVKLACEEFVW
jgi:hypothetical protein